MSTTDHASLHDHGCSSSMLAPAVDERMTPSGKKALQSPPESNETGSFKDSHPSTAIQTNGSDRPANGSSLLPVLVLQQQDLPSGGFKDDGIALRERRAFNANGSHKRNSLTLGVNGSDSGTEGSSLTVTGHERSLKEQGHHEADQKERVLKLSPDKLYELTTSPDALPIHVQELEEDEDFRLKSVKEEPSILQLLEQEQWQAVKRRGHNRKRSGSAVDAIPIAEDQLLRSPIATPNGDLPDRPSLTFRTMSSPMLKRKSSSNRPVTITPLALKLGNQRAHEERSAKKDLKSARMEDTPPSPLPSSIPLPPMSVPAYLQLELSSTKPSPLYIHRSSYADFPYESSKVKIDRLLNFLLLPWHLEAVLWFGAFACLDAWLYTFTVLPLRFAKALYLLILSAISNVVAEISYLFHFTYAGIGRLWQRKRSSSVTSETRPRDDLKTANTPSDKQFHQNDVAFSSAAKAALSSNASQDANHKRANSRHRRVRSAPSNLLPIDKADILKGLLIVVSCVILMYFDASMMYHSIRGQAAIKLYVIYNVLEVRSAPLSVSSC